MIKPITLLDIIQARKRIAPYIARTPLHHHRMLDQALGAEVYVKHENHQPIGSFKLRGALNVISQFSGDDRERGVIVASSGNFGQGIAYAASVFGIKANVVLPTDANHGKVDSIRKLGANVIAHGKVFDDSREHAEKLALEEGYRYVHSANEPNLVSGVGTYALEIMEDLPDVDVIVVPVGGGSGASGTCIASKALNPNVQVIGVQAEMAPAAYLSWKNGSIVEADVGTKAEGLETRIGFEFTQDILREMLDDFILVSESELEQAVVMNLEYTQNLSEHAGAAPLAAALKIQDRIEGAKVVLVMSGGNLTLAQLRTMFR